MASTKLNFKITQGATFTQVFRWESSTKVYKPISSILKQAPMMVMAAAHGIPAGWRTKITNLTGMKEISSSQYYVANSVTTDSVTINSVNSLGFSDYISGGILEYNAPVDLANTTARMQIREKLTSDSVILELTTENGKIVLDNTNKTITLNISATETAAFNFKSAVYSLELVKSGIVTPLVEGSITLIKEVTR